MILLRPPFCLSKIFWKSCLWSTLLALGLASPSQCDEAPVPTVKVAAITADAVQEAFVRVAEQIKPSVVTIYAERALPQFFSEQEKKTPEKDLPKGDQLKPGDPNDLEDDTTSLGTGMVLNTKGQILTNYHVVKDATVIHVLFDAQSERPERPLAKLIGFDEESDLAVLQLSPNGLRHAVLHPVEFADSDATRVGEWAIAIGAPFDQAQTVTVGVISAKGRHLTKDTRTSLQDYLQTDASINPGNSGGPLVDLKGKVIGINTAILSPSRFSVGIGFAVPSNAIKRYLPLLTNGKAIPRGFLGIQYVAIDEEVAREFGVTGGMQIGALAKRGNEWIGPAKNAGLEEGDIITHINGQSVISSDEFRHLVAGSPPGTTLQFTVVRPTNTAQETHSVTIVLADWSTQTTKKPLESPVLPIAVLKTSHLGMRLQNADELTLPERDFLGLDATATGAVVVEISPDSPADKAELHRGLRVIRVRAAGRQWQEITNKESFLRLENSLMPGTRVLLQVRDKENTLQYKLLTASDDN